MDGATSETDTSDETPADPGSIPVEAVDDLGTDGVTAPEYVLYGGKGGVGKTTMAAATGIGSATGGEETLVVSTDPAHSLGDIYEVELGPEPTRIDPDLPLFAVEIDPETALEERGPFGTGGDLDLGGLGAALDPGMSGDDGDMGNAMGDFDPAGLPGADEAAALQQLLRFLDDDRYDRVIIDTAPTGHTLRLLELPEVLDSFVGTIAKLRERFESFLAAIPGLGGDGGADLDAIAARIERLRAVLQDPARTDFRVVTVPETMAVTEAGRLLSQLEEYRIPVSTIVVNRVMESFDDIVPEADRHADPDAFVAPNPEHCRFCERRWAVQRDALETATDLFMGHDVKRVPLFGREVRGLPMLRAVAACLA